MANRQPVQELHLQNTQPNEPVYDARGIEVRVGDTVAIGARTGDSGDLKIARVTGFGTRKEVIRTRVRKHEPEYEDSRRWIRPAGQLYGGNLAYESPTFPFAVTVQVEYLSTAVFDRSNRKGYVRAYDRKFVVIGEASA